MLKKSPLLAALAMVLLLSGCFEDEKKAEGPAPAAAEIVQTSEGEVSDAVVMDGGEEMPVEITEEAAPAIDISALASGEWLLEQIRGAALTAGGAPSMTVEADGKVSGDSGCNRFFAESRPAPDNNISFLGIGSTKRACADIARNDQEMKFLNGLLAVATWHVDEAAGVLHLTDANGADVLVFSKAPAAEETEETPAAE
ncbi:MAG: META domain-containing protein [Alphaproteobacteria bacterium]|nr:META domain-containing protein [Alphaproteobacteria bacterium]